MLVLYIYSNIVGRINTKLKKSIKYLRNIRNFSEQSQIYFCKNVGDKTVFLKYIYFDF